MICIYRGAVVVDIVTIETFWEMTGGQLAGTVTELVQCSLIY